MWLYMEYFFIFYLKKKKFRKARVKLVGSSEPKLKCLIMKFNLFIEY